MTTGKLLLMQLARYANFCQLTDPPSIPYVFVCYLDHHSQSRHEEKNLFAARHITSAFYPPTPI